MNEYKAVNPSLDSELLSELFALEPLRYKFTNGTTPKWLFYDLKEILHLLESLSSARIEGNHTMLITAANEMTTEPEERKLSDDMNEIYNIRNAIAYAEENLHQGDAITLAFIRELHKIVTRGLQKDGSRTPGTFRSSDDIKIAQSSCVVSPFLSIQGDMQELMDYVNSQNDAKTDIVKIACSHHRFVAIHPFDNGNGRTARVFTYALLIKYGFLRNGKAILNPSSIFCMDRQKYYKMLSLADTLDVNNIENWCLYVAKGIRREMEKTYDLLEKDFAVNKVVSPALRKAYDNKLISELELKVLQVAIEKDTIQAGDVRSFFGSSASDATKCSRFLAKMVDKKLIMRSPKSPKKYVARIFNKALLGGILEAMDNNGLLDVKDEPIVK